MGSAEGGRALLSFSDHEREARHVEELEEIKAGIILLEQKLADQPGSQYVQRKLARARTRQGLWEDFLSTLRRKREFFYLGISESFVQQSPFLSHRATEYFRRSSGAGARGIRPEAA